MIEKKFNWKIYFFIILFGGVLLMASRVIFMLVTGQISDENDEPLPGFLVGLICFLLILVCITFAVTFVTLLRQVIRFKNRAFVIDGQGIYHTVVFINLFAFVIAVPIKQIPWSAVSYLDADNDSVYIRVKTRQVRASFLGKIILGILGYHFCYSFVTRPLTDNEKGFIIHCCSQSPYLQNCDFPV